MKRKAVIAGILTLLCLSMGAYAVEPAYTGHMGNAEEPALRPYKWLWHGTKSLLFQTGKSLERGNLKTPVLGTVEGCRGLRRGAVELGESAYKGAVCAVPPRGKGTYKETGKANKVIENEALLRNSSDAACSLYAYLALKAHDKWSYRNDEEADIMEEMAAKKRAERREPRQARKRAEVEGLTEVQKAQRTYVPDRSKAGSKKHQEGKGNLLKLAR